MQIYSYDNPETIRFKKYAIGVHLILQEARVETGRTPKEVLWEENKAKLYRYEPEKVKKHPLPILLVYALILKPYILDLVPGNSFVEYLIGEGFDVYLLDWGIPGDEDKHLSLENYVLDYMPEAAEQVLRSSGTEGLTLFGYCQGGTMSAMYASLFPQGPTKNLVLLATPIDFAPKHPGAFGLWTLAFREGYFDPDPLVETFGNVPADRVGRFIEGAAGVTGLIASSYINAYATRWWKRMSMRDKSVESFLAACQWVDDGVPFPGEAFRQWIRDFYQKNKLIKGELELRGRRLDLSNTRCPVLNIAGSNDFICPLPQAEVTTSLIGSRDKEFLVLDAGHVGLMAGPVAKEELWPSVRYWLEPRSR